MSTWNSLYGSRGIYQSPVIDASSNFDYYISNINANYVTNDGGIEIEIRSSHDGGVTWGDWFNINDGLNKTVFDGNGVQMTDTKFQYKVILDMSGNIYGVSPQFNQISVVLSGAFKVENTGDVACLPEVWFKKSGSSGTIMLTNETTGQNVIFNNINNNETIYVDNENRDIKTDLPLKYRYSDHNKEWLELQTGENILTGIGRFELEMKNEYKVLQG